MDDAGKAFAPELSAAGSKRWIGRLIVAVLVGIAIWNLVVTLTRDVVLPALAQVMEADSQSPFYLGRGDILLAPILTAVLELCFALIAAILVNSWMQRAPRPARRRVVKAAPAAMPSIAPPAPAPQPIGGRAKMEPTPASAEAAGGAQPAVQVAPVMAAPPVPAAPPPSAKVSTAPASAKPEKAKRPKKVYYNLMGEPVESDEDE
jgi:hypothetical protein